MVHLVQIKTIPIKTIPVKNTINQSNDLNSISEKIDNLIKKDPKDRISSDQILEHPFLKNAHTKN